MSKADIADVEDKVKAVIQVAGMNSLVRIDPKDDTKGTWFRAVSISLIITHHARFLLFPTRPKPVLAPLWHTLTHTVKQNIRPARPPNHV